MSFAHIDKKIIAQLIRDICVEAVVTYEQRGELDKLRINTSPDGSWLTVAEHFCNTVEKINQTLPSHPPE